MLKTIEFFLEIDPFNAKSTLTGCELDNCNVLASCSEAYVSERVAVLGNDVVFCWHEKTHFLIYLFVYYLIGVW